MAWPDYVLDCPSCGAQLQFHVGPAQDAPWQCNAPAGGCGRGWWSVELSPDARMAWRPDYRDHLGSGYEFHAELHEARMAELAEALGRRTSVRFDHLPLLNHGQLIVLQRFLTPQADAHPLAAQLLDEVDALLASVGH